MSIRAMTWAFSLELKPSPLKFLLLALSDYADAHGRAWPSVTALAAKTSQDRKTVIGGLDELERLGLLADTGDRVGKTSQVKVYRITADEVLEPAVREKRPESGTVPNQKAPATVAEGSRASAERVPPTVHGSVREPSKEPQSARARGTAARGASETERWVYLRELARANGFRGPDPVELQCGVSIYESALRLHLRDVPRGTLTRDAAHFMGYERATA